MKRKFEKLSFNICGEIYSYYICLIKKHWWSKWTIVMDGSTPMTYDLINNEYIPKL